jgi:hypothetical protein
LLDNNFQLWSDNIRINLNTYPDLKYSYTKNNS